MKLVIKMTENEFTEQVLNSKKPVVVEFTWTLSLVTEIIGQRMIKVLKKYNGEVEFLQLDSFGNPELKRKYHIPDIPTYLFFNKGQVVDKLTGFANENEIVEKVEKLVRSLENKNS